MLTYYPDVVPAGLSDALSRRFAEGSALTAYPPVPPEKPVWSPFSDHPDAPGMIVPEFARVEAGDRACQVKIGSFEVPLGWFSVAFFTSDSIDVLARPEGRVDLADLDATMNVIVRVYERDAEIHDVAEELGVTYHDAPPPPPDPVAFDRFRERLLLAVRIAEHRGRAEEPDPREFERSVEHRGG
jgi:hypothetical protein